jgi:uncharacterized protein DUF2721
VTEASQIAAVAHVIQLAVAPVFLLSGISGMLVVMTNRLARVVDRARALEATLSIDTPTPTPVHAELTTLARRAKLVSGAITLCTVTALLVSAVIATLFLGDFVRFDVSFVVALLFLASMAAFFAALILFLREILIATRTMRIGPQ